MRHEREEMTHNHARCPFEARGTALVLCSGCAWVYDGTKRAAPMENDA